MNDDAQRCFLYEHIHHPDLQVPIETLKAQTTAGQDITFTKAANHLSTAVSKLPEYIQMNRKIAGVAQYDTPESIYDDKGNVKTHVRHWHLLSDEQKAKVTAAQKKAGRRASGGKHNNSTKHAKANQANRMKQLEAQNKKYKRKIKSLRRANDDTDEEKED